MIVVSVVIAGIAGAVIRFAVSRLSASRSTFPWAVLAVNVVGSALGGVIVALWVYAGLSTEWRLILFTGFCGGLTTFSTFSVESVQLAIAGRYRVLVGSVAANLVLGVGAVAVAFAIASALAR
ncbi:MAG TPA: CrcB family protein [Kofleriaceae bacterium]